ncbi:MAG: pSRTUE45c [Sphaerisporangium sp.]|nr:pSRTUE45c [Sphaerisporangium sp.]
MGRKHSRAGRGPLLVLLACALAVPSATLSDSSAAAQTQADCISTPLEYRTAWEQREVRCVSPSLFGTTHARGSASLYPSGFWYAWAGSSTNLERYLALRNAYGDNPPKVGIGILSYAGYPGLNDWSVPTNLAVYTLPVGVQALVPSFETWFRLLDEEFGTSAAYPLSAQTDLVVAYSRLAPHEDVVGVFEAVTGCKRAALLKGKDPSVDIGCNASFRGALAAAGPSPYTTGESKSCFQNFASGYNGPRDAAAMRAVLFQCQDVGFLNTGVGLGYNTYANPFVCKPASKQSVRQKYTGREFILPNMNFDALPSQIDIELELGEPSERGFLETGYCSTGCKHLRPFKKSADHRACHCASGSAGRRSFRSISTQDRSLSACGARHEDRITQPRRASRRPGTG